MNIRKTERETVFHHLSPEKVISLVESALGRHCTNLCRPLNSYINRVYELETDERQGLVVKFYRPSRWSGAALQDEHDFLLELQEQDIPVIAPLAQHNGKTLGQYGDIYFAVFPKKGGRSYDEYSDEQWLQLGRLLGRTHNVGARKMPRDRLVLSPGQATRKQVDYILQGGFLSPEQVGQYRDVAEKLIAEITPYYENIELIRIHGDCHFSNLIYRPGESFYLIDFDDMALGPPVHDFWMLLPGYLHDSLTEIDFFLEGYETFRPFDRRSLRLIEPLRAMRYIHFTSWCAHQVAEDGSSRVMEDFGSYVYWQTEIRDLTEQLDRIRRIPAAFANFW